MWIGDVGETTQEEITLGGKGTNHGWPFNEGTVKYNAPLGGLSDCGMMTPNTACTAPQHAYPRGDGTSVTGGLIPPTGCGWGAWENRYFFADYNSGTMWTLDVAGDRRSAMAELAQAVRADGRRQHRVLPHGSGRGDVPGLVQPGQRQACRPQDHPRRLQRRRRAPARCGRNRWCGRRHRRGRGSRHGWCGDWRDDRRFDGRNDRWGLGRHDRRQRWRARGHWRRNRRARRGGGERRRRVLQRRRWLRPRGHGLGAAAPGCRTVRRCRAGGPVGPPTSASLNHQGRASKLGRAPLTQARFSPKSVSLLRE